MLSLNRRLGAAAWGSLLLAVAQLCCGAAPADPAARLEPVHPEPRRRPSSSTHPSRPRSPAERIAHQRRQLLIQANVSRRMAGRAPLARHPALDRAAQRHAEEMLRRRYFDHEDRRGRGPGQRARDAGYPGKVIAENLVRGTDSPPRVVQLWLRSDGHRRNLLDPTYSRTGIGYATTGDPGTSRIYWVQIYGK